LVTFLSRKRLEPHGGGKPCHGRQAWQGGVLAFSFLPTQSKQPWQAYVPE